MGLHCMSFFSSALSGSVSVRTDLSVYIVEKKKLKKKSFRDAAFSMFILGCCINSVHLFPWFSNSLKPTSYFALNNALIALVNIYH